MKKIDESTIIFCMAVAALAGKVGYELYSTAVDSIYNERGTVISKANHELTVDTNGDRRPDRVLHFSSMLENGALYEYALPGDRISYTNKKGADTLYIDVNSKCVKELAGRTPREIYRQYTIKRRTR